MERLRYSEELGQDAVFTAEGYGSEGIVPLGHIAAHTSRLKLGTRVAEVTGRAQAVSAIAFQTLNHLVGGDRVIVGLGSASHQAVEGSAAGPQRGLSEVLCKQPTPSSDGQAVGVVDRKLV